MTKGVVMKCNWIHRTALVLNALLVCFAMTSCLKEGEKTILVNDPQDIPFITEYLPVDLLNLFGEENVHFGDQPPVINLEFKSMHQYVATNLQPPFAPQVGQLSPITHYHKINQQYLQIADYISMTSEETYCKVISPVYLTGRCNDFTVYYHEAPQTDGHPEHAVLFSGTLTHSGVRNLRYGYKILKYNDSIVPLTVYPASSIFIFKDYDGMAEACTWYNNSLVNP